MFRAGLTDEQARNIATDEDTTLVLAGAATGKTAVIIGKIAHLVLLAQPSGNRAQPCSKAVL